MSEKVIVTFTSYTKRIHLTSIVVKNIFSQTIIPDMILLWLSTLEFPNKENDLPKELLELVGINNFEICWVKENLKSHKKYYYALQEYADNIIITIDDDICYSQTMIEELLNSYYRFPNSISARNVHMILKEGKEIASYNKWNRNCRKYNQVERHDLCAIGWGGILYPPNIATKRWFDIDTIQKLCLYQDDLWLKINEILDRISIVYVKKMREDKIIEDAQINALYNQNLYENQNDICMKKLCNWGKKEKNDVIEEWISCVYNYDKYYNLCRKKLALDLFDILNKYNKVYICGAGNYAKALIRLFRFCCKYEAIEGLIVSENRDNIREVEGIPIISINDIKTNSNDLVICGVSEKYRESLKDSLKDKLGKWVDMDIDTIYNSFK